MYDPSLELTYEVDAEVREFFGDIVFDTVIPRAMCPSRKLRVMGRAYWITLRDHADHELTWNCAWRYWKRD